MSTPAPTTATSPEAPPPPVDLANLTEDELGFCLDHTNDALHSLVLANAALFSGDRAMMETELGQALRSIITVCRTAGINPNLEAPQEGGE